MGALETVNNTRLLRRLLQVIESKVAASGRAQLATVTSVDPFEITLDTASSASTGAVEKFAGYNNVSLDDRVCVLSFLNQHFVIGPWTGTQGTGEQGAQGPAGPGVYVSVDSPPTLTDIAVGSLCMIEGTGEIWEYESGESGDVWTDLSVSLQGPQGATGATGATGPSADLSYVESYITETITLATSTPTNITSVSLSAGTWLVTARGWVLNSSTSEGLVIAAWIGPTSASQTDAYAAVEEDCDDSTSGTVRRSVSITKVIVLTETTTVYLIMSSNGDTLTVQNVVGAITTAAVTGITAVQIG